MWEGNPQDNWKQGPVEEMGMRRRFPAKRGYRPGGLSRLFWLLMVGPTWLVACETGPSTFPIVDRPDLLVTVQAAEIQSRAYSHPFQLDEVTVAKVLRKVKVIQRDRALGFGILGQHTAVPAFSDLEIVRLAPSVARAFRMSSPWDVVTFYSVTLQQGEEGRVTSGGLFVTDKRYLHIFLANCRSRPSETSNSFVTGSELDHRKQPLIPIGRYQFQVRFDPEGRYLVQDDLSGSPWPSYIDSGQTLVIDLPVLFPDLAAGQS